MLISDATKVLATRTEMTSKSDQDLRCLLVKRLYECIIVNNESVLNKRKSTDSWESDTLTYKQYEEVTASIEKSDTEQTV